MTAAEIELSRHCANGTVPSTFVVKRRTRNLCLVETSDAPGKLADQYLVSSEQNEPVIRVIREKGKLMIPPPELDAVSELAKKILAANRLM